MITGAVPHVRVARPSRDLDAATAFYTRALGLDVPARFADHAGIDGVILGRASWPDHLELTRHRAHPRTPRPSDEDLLVLYLPDAADWGAALERRSGSGARPVASANPYWGVRGVTFEDPDGYRVVLQHERWVAG